MDAHERSPTLVTINRELVLQPRSCWPQIERARRDAEVSAFEPSILFRGCSKCAFAPLTCLPCLYRGAVSPQAHEADRRVNHTL